MTLPYDIARCPGTDDPRCASCRRREPGRPEWQTYIAPRITNAGCRHRIPADDGGGQSDEQGE